MGEAKPKFGFGGFREALSYVQTCTNLITEDY